MVPILKRSKIANAFKFLLEHPESIDCNAVDTQQGNIALINAGRFQNEDVVKLLLGYKCIRRNPNDTHEINNF